MTHLVLSTDASVINDSAGIGYAVERVGDDGEQVEMLVKECEDVSSSCPDGHHESVHTAEYVAVVRGVEAARKHLDDERLVIRCDNRNIVRKIESGDVDQRFDEAIGGVEWDIRNIPRILNSVADSLSKQASRGRM